MNSIYPFAGSRDSDACIFGGCRSHDAAAKRTDSAYAPQSPPFAKRTGADILTISNYSQTQQSCGLEPCRRGDITRTYSNSLFYLYILHDQKTGNATKPLIKRYVKTTTRNFANRVIHSSCGKMEIRLCNRTLATFRPQGCGRHASAVAACVPRNGIAAQGAHPPKLSCASAGASFHADIGRDERRRLTALFPALILTFVSALFPAGFLTFVPALFPASFLTLILAMILPGLLAMVATILGRKCAGKTTKQDCRQSGCKYACRFHFKLLKWMDMAARRHGCINASISKRFTAESAQV